MVALVLASFLAVATSVVWRRSLGSTQARRLHALGATRAELEARRAQLDGDVRRAASRPQLVPMAQRLGMRVPDDSQVVWLARPRSPER
jgi:type II secretory pathway component PulJ